MPGGVVVPSTRGSDTTRVEWRRAAAEAEYSGAMRRCDKKRAERNDIMLLWGGVDGGDTTVDSKAEHNNSAATSNQ